MCIYTISLHFKHLFPFIFCIFFSVAKMHITLGMQEIVYLRVYWSKECMHVSLHWFMCVCWPFRVLCLCLYFCNCAMCMVYLLLLLWCMCEYVVLHPYAFQSLCFIPSEYKKACSKLFSKEWYFWWGFLNVKYH